MDVELEAMRRAVLDAPVDAVAGTVARWVARQHDATAVVRLADRIARTLHPVAASDGDADEHPWWSLRDGAAADAFWRREVRREEVAGTTSVHVPLAARGDVHGVLTVDGVDGAGADPDGYWRSLGEVAALLLAQADRLTDAWEIRRRSHSFSVSAEMQWQLLPPTAVVTDGVELHALVEPAPRVSSDLFDWSLDDGRLWLAVLDADGRSLSAALPASVALAALRHARRCRLPLAEQVALADQAVHDQFRGHAVVRALVAEIEPGRGGARVVTAGERGVAPHLLRRRDGRAEELATAEHEDLGRFDRSRYAAEEVDLAAGDDVLVVTDGAGAFGLDAVTEHFAAMERPSAHPRRLLDALREHGGGELTQDATALVVSL